MSDRKLFLPYSHTLQKTAASSLNTFPVVRAALIFSYDILNTAANFKSSESTLKLKLFKNTLRLTSSKLEINHIVSDMVRLGNVKGPSRR